MASESGLVTVTRWKSSRMDEPAWDCQWFSQKMRACTQLLPPTWKEMSSAPGSSTWSLLVLEHLRDTHHSQQCSGSGKASFKGLRSTSAVPNCWQLGADAFASYSGQHLLVLWVALLDVLLAVHQDALLLAGLMRQMRLSWKDSTSLCSSRSLPHVNALRVKLQGLTWRSLADQCLTHTGSTTVSKKRSVFINWFLINICWFYNNQNLYVTSSGQQVVSDYTHKIVVKEDGTQSLIIVPATPQDSGEWTVVAQNRAGRSSISVTLTVDGKTTTHLSQEDTGEHWL